MTDVMEFIFLNRYSLGKEVNNRKVSCVVGLAVLSSASDTLRSLQFNMLWHDQGSLAVAPPTTKKSST